MDGRKEGRKEVGPARLTNLHSALRPPTLLDTRGSYIRDEGGWSGSVCQRAGQGCAVPSGERKRRKKITHTHTHKNKTLSWKSRKQNSFHFFFSSSSSSLPCFALGCEKLLDSLLINSQLSPPRQPSGAAALTPTLRGVMAPKHVAEDVIMQRPRAP